MSEIKITNFYELVPQSQGPPNPHYKKHGIKLPFRLLVVGPTGSMKTNTALNFLKAMNDTFDRVVVCCRSKDEPLYHLLEEKLGPQVKFYENGEVPKIGDFNKDEQTLAIFDDLVTKKDQKAIEDIFIAGRKVGISSMYISQSYFKTPKIIRIQCNYIALKKLPSEQDLKAILREYSLGVTKNELLDIYRFATQKSLDFLLIDTEAEPEKKFRKNFSVIKYR